jgi:hypothetical protein
VKLGDPGLTTMAREVRRSPAQVLLRWSLQKGFVTIPKSAKKELMARLRRVSPMVGVDGSCRHGMRTSFASEATALVLMLRPLQARRAT